MKIYNTLGREKQEFKPLKNGQLLMYHCGPTVYWTQHIGNMRGMVMADLVVRTFEYLDYKVKMVRNYTDVGHLTSDEDFGEDKMERAAKRDNLAPAQIANKYIEIFEADILELNTVSADIKPKATEMIPEIIAMIKIILEKGYAYETDLAVYFDVSKIKNYTQLSGQKIEENLKDAGHAEVSDNDKKNPADFALWFFKAGVHKNALQFWPSPFHSSLVKNGEGFPGWHIECSAMAKKFLGETIDIHMGGIEHVPVHHTNEIAQSESANGVKFVHYWLHNEHLMVDNKKMSKSEGSVYSLSDVKEKGFKPLALRYFFLQAHYRSKQNFTWESLQAASSGLKNLQEQILNLGKKQGQINKNFKEKFKEKINDDFNISASLALAQEVLKSNLPSEDKLATLLDFDKVWGLCLDKIKSKKNIIPANILQLAKERQKARENKNWSQADNLRQEIENLGYMIKDSDNNNYNIVKKEI